ncbi:ATP-binding protein [Lachnospira eligens]|uniref:ATP-binding protein n=1 Tax=Lachnospira eligens TaxID=39485 RepID=UPI0016511C4E|nr:ATP-binding protein [Lachnospira eligens]
MVEDYGTGMNENELSNYLFKTANSGYKYMKKREFMFPAIAKFGIGFVACLTKADKIQILTQTQSDNGINAEIESKSTIAFIEKNIQRACQGTTVILHVKEKYSFNELKNYVFTYFGCPSVEIDLVDVDTLNIYADGSTVLDESECILQIVEHTELDESECILQIVEHTEQKRNYGINKILPDYKCLMKMMEILSDEAEIDGTIAKVRNMLRNRWYDC